MFVFILEVLAGDGPGSDGPGSDGPGSFFTLLKKAKMALRTRGGCKATAPLASTLRPYSGPPLAAPAVPAGIVSMALPILESPFHSGELPPLMPSPAPSLHMSPEFVLSQTPTLEATPIMALMPMESPSMPLAPINPIPSPVTLGQVEDILTTSEMVCTLQTRTRTWTLFPDPTPMSVDAASPSPPAVPLPGVPYDGIPKLEYPWLMRHPLPHSNFSDWVTDALAQDIPAYVLECMIQTMHMPMTKSEKKQMNTHLKALDSLMHGAI